MAFNPFSSFRRHKKVIFATLTIICMFTFVLAGNFRGADAFDWLIQKLGGSGNQGEVVTTLYGDKVYQGQLDDRIRLRQAANDFARKAVDFSVVPLQQELETLAKNVEAPTDPNSELSEFRSVAQMVHIVIRIMTDPSPQFDRIRRDQHQMTQLMFQFQFSGDTMQRLRPKLARKNMDSELATLDAMIMFHTFHFWKMSSQDPQNVFLFGGSLSRQDTLDFMMWLKQADTLGIKLTDDDIRTLLNRLTPMQKTLTGKKAEDQKTLANLFQKEAQYDLQTIYKALGDEYRVSLAKGIILGEEPGFLGQLGNAFRTPLGVTPGEYVEYFREQLQATDVVLLPVPVAGFTSSKEIPEPTPRDIEDLFERYRNEEPRPMRSTPGFRIPHRVQVQWVSDAKVKKETFLSAARVVPLGGWLAAVEDPRLSYYEQRARQHYAQLAAALVGQSVVPGGHLGQLAAADDGRLSMQEKLPLGMLHALNNLNSAVRRARSDYRVPSLLEADPSSAYHTAAALTPELAARTAALALDGQGLYASPFATVSAALWMQRAAADRAAKDVADPLKEERTRRARVVAGLTANSIGSTLPAVWPWYWADGQGKYFEEESGKTLPPKVFDEYIALDLIRGRYLEQVLLDTGARLEEEDTTEFLKKMVEAKGDKDKSEKIVADTIAKMRLQQTKGESRYYDDRWTLQKDPGLTPLIAAAAGRGSDLVASLFSNSPLYKPEVTGGLRDQPRFFFWKTMNEPGKLPKLDDIADPKTKDTVREQVKQAWRTMEARKIAKKEAEAIAARVKDKGEKEALKVFNDLLKSNPDWGKLIRYEGLARKKSIKSLDAGEQFRYEEFKFPEDEIAYPSMNFLSALLKIEENETDVLKDQPEKHFYVAYVVNRHAEPTVADAVKELNRSKILPDFEKQEKQDTRAAIIEELRRQAAGKDGLNARGRFVLNPKLKKNDEDLAE